MQADLRLGLLSATAARELARLPRGNQLRAAQAVRDHELTSRQTARLVEHLQKNDDPAARRELDTDKTPHAMSAACDPRLSDSGNRLRRL